VADKVLDHPLELHAFAAQSLDLVDWIAREVLQYKRMPDEVSRIDSILWAIRIVEESSTVLELVEISGVSRKLETLLGQLRMGKRSLSEEVVEALFEGVTLVRSLVQEVSPDEDVRAKAKAARDNARIENYLDSLDKLSVVDRKLQEEQSGAGGVVALLSPEPEPDALLERLLNEFQMEALGNIDEAEQCLLGLDHAHDDLEALNELFRRIHTIKGTASYVGLHAISEQAHALEGLLELVRQRDAFEMSDTLLDICFETVDSLRYMIGHPSDSKIAVDLLRRLAEEKDIQGAAGRRPAQSAASLATDPLAIFIDSASQHRETMQVCLERADRGDGDDANSLDMFFRAAHSMKSGARYMGFDQMEEDANRIENLLEPMRRRETGYTPAILAQLGDCLRSITLQLARIVGNTEVDSHPTPEDLPARTVGMPAAEDQAGSSQPVANASVQTKADVKTMRINQKLLDGFMNLVGELIVARNALGHVEKRLGEEVRESLPCLRELHGACQAITRISDEMQRNVMEMRLTPVRTVFQKFPRIIRDISQKNGKKIDLVLQGEETEIDKGIAEEIGDPLVHIIRNAADHGIESPEARRKAGKSERGTVILKAAQEGNFVVIEAVDDGAGMDPEAILAKAVAKGMVRPAIAQTLSRDEILQLIFRPGFSTAEAVTAISGRGVGMDVVLTNMRKLNGNVKVDSQAGIGTRIRLELPLTLAVVEALLVGVGEETYAIPVEAVRETVKIKRRSVKRMMRKKALALRGEVVGMETLSSLLDLSPASGGKTEAEEVPVIILQRGGEVLGVAVDRLYRQEEIVIKPLVDYLASLSGLAGASILGDGRALLILDPDELIAMALQRQGS